MPTAVQVCCGQARSSAVRSARNTSSRGARSGWPVTSSYSTWPASWGTSSCSRAAGATTSTLPGSGGDLGERLVEQDGQVAVADPAGLEPLAVGVGPSRRTPAPPWDTWSIRLPGRGTQQRLLRLLASWSQSWQSTRP